MKQEIKDRVEQIRQGIIPKGYKDTVLGIVPSDWEITRLDQLAEVIDGDRSSNYPSGKDIVDEGILFLSTKNIIDEHFNFNEKKFITEEKFDSIKRGKLVRDDLVITMRGTIGNIARFANEEYDTAFINAQMSIIRPNKINSAFIWIILNSIIMPRYLPRIRSGSAQPQLTKGDVKKLPILYPVKSEQQKIVAISSIWDRAIELKESLIKEKEEQKKGLMQELLRPVDSTQWFTVKLRDLGKTYNGLTGKTRKDFGTGKKFITFKNIFDNPKLNLNVFDRVLLKQGEKQNMIKYGDVFFTTSSETPHEVGMSSVLLDEIEEDIYLNSFCFGFRLNNFEEVLPEFLRYYLRGDSFRYEMIRLAQGSTRFNLSKTELLKITLEVPSISQQQRIAKILSTADKEIDLLKQEVEQLKEQKKGLMQLLLTGIVRVKEVVTSG